MASAAFQIDEMLAHKIMLTAYAMSPHPTAQIMTKFIKQTEDVVMEMWENHVDDAYDHLGIKNPRHNTALSADACRSLYDDTLQQRTEYYLDEGGNLEATDVVWHPICPRWSDLTLSGIIYYTGAEGWDDFNEYGGNPEEVVPYPLRACEQKFWGDGGVRGLKEWWCDRH
tara:strand:- start:50 stop:559 length:510 start_codon:yes stop_codon:yes gene_type:complete